MLREKLRMLADGDGTWIKIVLGVSYFRDQLSDPDVWFLVAIVLAAAYEYFKGLRRLYAYDRGEEESFAAFMKRFSREIGQGCRSCLRAFFQDAHVRLVTTRARMSEALNSRKQNKA